MTEQFSDAQVEAAAEKMCEILYPERRWWEISGELRGMMLAAARSSLAAASALAWRRLDEFPDKTKAPWDGNLVDVWRVATDARPLLPVGRIPNAKNFRDGEWGYMVSPGQFNALDDGVTHWQPLPAPPQARP